MLEFLEHNVFYPDLNFVARERLDPLVSLFLDYFGISHVAALYVFGELIILFVGMILLLSLFTDDRVKQLLGGLFAVLVTVFLLGTDPFLLRLHWFPWLLAGMSQLARTRTWFGVPPAGAVTLMWIASAGSLAVLGIVIAAAISLWIAPSRASIDTLIAERRQAPLTFLCLAAVALAVLWIPKYPMPSYPAGARVVAGSSFDSFSPPLLGPYLHPLPFEKEVFDTASRFFSVQLLFLSICLAAVFVIGVIGKQRPVRGGFVAALGIILVSVLLVAGQLYGSPASAPFFVVASLVPGVSLAGLPWSLLGFSVVCITLVLFYDNPLSVAVALVVVASVAVLGGRVSGWYDNIPRQSVENIDLLATDAAFRVSQSVSRPIVETYGAWIAEEGIAERRHFGNLRRLRRDVDFSWSVTANPNPQLAELALDGDVFTRWKTDRSQRPGDMFQIDFTEATPVVRVVLSIKDNPAEYPRGIRMLGGLSQDSLQEIVRQPRWFGPVKWTKEGFPYFGAHHQVILDFPKQERVQVLRFEQLAESSFAAWSINEVKLYAEKDGNSSQPTR